MQASATKSYSILLFILCFLGGAFGGLTSTLVPSYLPVLIKDFASGDEESIGAIINSVFIFGMLVGGLVLGFLSDRWGRKTGLQISVICLGLFTLLTSFVQDWYWITLCRFVTGFGVGGVLLTTTILIAEVWTADKKAIALGILSICFPVGIFSAGLITYNVAHWRNAFLVGILPLILFVFIQIFIKESSEWRAYQTQDKPDSRPAFRLFFGEIIHGSVIYGTMLIGLWAVFAWLPTWVQSVVQNSDGQQERGISMMLFAAGGLIGGIVSGWLVAQWGMKKVLLCCFGGAFLLSCLLFRFTGVLNLFNYAEMLIIALFFGISQGVLNVYIPELFPIAIRSAATGICFNISRIFTATVVFFVGWLVYVLNGYSNALLTFSSVFLVGFLALFLSKEKKLFD
jgi:MFS family permease